MSIRKKVVGIVGALALSMTMAGGIASAEVVTSSDTSTIGITVLCGANNTQPSSIQLLENGNVGFEGLDPNDPAQLALRSTGAMAIRVQVDIDECQTGAWHVSATISDFKSGSDVMPGTKFQLPIGGELSSTTATDAGGNEVTAVTAPSVSLVTFAGEDEPYAGSNAIMSSAGGVSGVMHMDYTGQLANLDASTADGKYEGRFTVTFQPGNP